MTTGDAPHIHDRAAGSGDTRPVPDPTLLTTQQTLREIGALKELLLSEIRSLRDEHDTRFDGMDKAIALIQAAADRVPSEVDLKVGNLQALHAEKFLGIATQFAERDSRTEQTARDSKLAIDAALQAAKEAVGKTETAFSKSIDQLGELIGVNNRNLSERIDEVKGRLDQIAGVSTGSSASWGIVAAGAGFILTLATVAVAVIALSTR